MSFNELDDLCFFTVIVAYGGSKKINKLLKTIYSGKISDKIQVLLVKDKKHKDKIYDIISDEYAPKVEKLTANSKDLLDVYNAAKEKIQGQYVCFINDRMRYEADTFSSVYKRLKDNPTDMISVRPVFIDNSNAHKPYPVRPLKSGIIYSHSNKNEIQFYMPACFFKKSVLSDIQFDETLKLEKDKDFLMKYYVKYDSFYYLDEKSLYYFDSAENEFATNMIQYEKDWYLSNPENFLLDRIKNISDLDSESQQLVRVCVLYLLFARYNCNTNDRNKKVLNDAEIEEFISCSKEILKYIPETVILKKRKSFAIPRSLKFLFIKYRCDALGIDYVIRENNKQFSVECFDNSNIKNDCFISNIRNERVAISAINYDDNKLLIDFKSNLIDFLNVDDINIKVYLGDAEVEVEEVYCYPLIKLFGSTFAKKKQFRAFVPLEEGDISFKLVLNGVEYPQKIKYATAASRLTLAYSKSYWNIFGDYMLYHNGSKKKIRLKKMTYPHRMLREVRLLKQMLQKDKEDTKKMVNLRAQYFLQKPLYKNKRIWVMFDKLYKGGDNGEYMYHYLKSHPELGITPYYIINEDAPDYAHLKKSKENVLITNSDKCRKICLNAEVILATHTSVWNYCGFSKQQQLFVRDLLKAKIVCIQHGLTVQKIAQYQNRLFDNTNFYCCASQCEVDNILQPIYGYDKRDVVLTGLARYDGLKNADKKQILITPTWRRDIVNNGIACKKKTHNSHFKSSTYFKVYNNLINNEKLIETAKETGYRIIYLLHPAMSAQSVDFDRNDSVEIVEAAGDMSYEKILTESSLMVTDYSGVQFDFAYMRKPIVYYHPDVLPPFYEEGVFKYDTMGFGDICTNENEIIDTLCDYMKNGCKIKNDFLKRADTFFAYDDFGSCARIYNEVNNFLRR